MLDPKFIRDNPETVKNVIKSGRGDPQKADVDAWLVLDSKRGELLTRVGEINKKRNELSKAGKSGDVEKIREEGKYLKEEVKKVEKELYLLIVVQKII